jgi:hypothetical protein
MMDLILGAALCARPSRPRDARTDPFSAFETHRYAMLPGRRLMIDGPQPQVSSVVGDASRAFQPADHLVELLQAAIAN